MLPTAVAVTQLAGWYHVLALAAAASAATSGDIEGTVASVLAMSSALSVEVPLAESRATLALLESLPAAAPPPQPMRSTRGINPKVKFMRVIIMGLLCSSMSRLLLLQPGDQARRPRKPAPIGRSAPM